MNEKIIKCDLCLNILCLDLFIPGMSPTNPLNSKPICATCYLEIRQKYHSETTNNKNDDKTFLDNH